MRRFMIAASLLLFSTGALAQGILPFSLPWMNHPDQNDELTVMYNTSDHPNGIFVIEAYFKA